MVVVHGGAGRYPSSECADREAGCRVAAHLAWQWLVQGGTAVEAAVMAVSVLETLPLFNAGVGAPMNGAGQVELDAAVMDGRRGRFAGVAAVNRVAQPARLAQALLADGRAGLLVGAGAAEFARETGVPLCTPHYLAARAPRPPADPGPGTVGCVTLDSEGGLAAVTSTGGPRGKPPGRVGDSPLPGCGTFADRSAAVSCTGAGEALLNCLTAKVAAQAVADGYAAQEAAQAALRHLEARCPAEAGLIVVDHAGRLGWSYNSPHLALAWRRGDQAPASSV